MNIAAGPCVVLGDIHPPYHDLAALCAATEVMLDVKPGAIVFNGDCLDCFQLSKFDGEPKRRLELQKDLDIAAGLLAGFRKLFPGIPFYYKWGNHEQRLERWLHAHPEVCELRCLQLGELLKLPDIDCALIPAHEPLWFGGFFITHGDRVRSRAGYTAHSMIDKYGLSGISNHVHRLAHVRRKQWNREFEWIENGCLCSLTPHYADFADWQHGFSILQVVEGEIFPEVVQIREGRAWYGGRMYRA